MNSNLILFFMHFILHRLFRLAPALVADMKTSAALRPLLAQGGGGNRRARPVLAGVLLVLGMTPAVFAQPQGDSGGVHFRTLGWGVASADLYYFVDGEDVGVRIFDSVRSGFHAYPKEGKISFYRIVKHDDDTLERVIVAQGDLTGTGPTPLLILTKSKTDPDKLTVNVIADDLAAFPERTCRFVNFTPVEIGVTVGPQIDTVPPGGIRLVDTNLEEDERTRYVTAFVSVSDDQLFLTYNNWVFRPGQRVMVLIHVDKDGQPRVLRLVDAVAQLKALRPPDDSR
ncbi:MAG: hypothetical protein JJU05_08955 [Verrucomicrobia bacterium]|nr:hypothetical protein [Verrucomicrobiota bacterium]